VEECFLDYSGFYYTRSSKFENLPLPAYIPGGTPESGTFEYLEVVNEDPLTFMIAQDYIFDVVFGGEENISSNIAAFAQAADDTRAVINYMHSYPVPDEYATQPTCEERTYISYDVFINQISGLQVPKNIIAGADEREFTVSGGITTTGDAANVEVTVVAVNNNGVSETFIYEDVLGPSNPTFQYTEFVPTSLTINGATIIEWLATITDTAGLDYNPTNNEKDGESIVLQT